MLAVFRGTPDWIRTSGLQSRSYQAVKPESPAAQGLGWYSTNFRYFGEKTSEALPCKASEVFCDSSQIVV